MSDLTKLLEDLNELSSPPPGRSTLDYLRELVESDGDRAKMVRLAKKYDGEEDEDEKRNLRFVFTDRGAAQSFADEIGMRAEKVAGKWIVLAEQKHETVRRLLEQLSQLIETGDSEGDVGEAEDDEEVELDASKLSFEMIAPYTKELTIALVAAGDGQKMDPDTHTAWGKLFKQPENKALITKILRIARRGMSKMAYPAARPRLKDLYAKLKP